MGAKFQGVQQQQAGPITCKVDSSVLEPHFAKAPGEMRKLNKEDKAQAQELVREGGRKVQAETQTAGYYLVSLNLSPEEFFRDANNVPPLDGKEQVLLLQRCL